MESMFNHRYRYPFILVLAIYTFVNTVLCDVYHYFQIDISWYYALLTIFLVTLLTWEGNRLLEGSVRKKFPPTVHKIRFLVVFFILGNIVAGISAAAAVWLVGKVILGNAWEINLNPFKLNLIYAGLVNLFFHLLHAIYFFFQEYQRHWREVGES